MKEAGRGRIINITSSAFNFGVPFGLSPYIASKGGLCRVGLRAPPELASFGVTVNAVAPGKVMMDKERIDMLTAAADLVDGQKCIARPSGAEDIVGVVEFLASDAASFITGQVYNVDDGWALS